jgi:amino acid adenylation domain-containing protein
MAFAQTAAKLRCFPTETTFIPHLVTTQARSAPDSTALLHGNNVLSYGELNARSDRLAHRLRLLGVGPDVLVALYIQRSFNFVIGALGIMKAGGAYVPLDPAYPMDRTEFMLTDSQVDIVVTHSDLALRLPTGKWQAVSVDSRELIDEDGAFGPSGVNISGRSLAYMIYTSGSTGQPKGVEITHASLLNLVCWHNNTFAVTSRDKATQLASLSFDATVWEVWPYLAAGARLYLVDDLTRKDPEALRAWFLAQKITLSFVPTALAERMIGLQWPADADLRFLLTGADTLHRYPPAGLPFALVNNYGPTECTVVATSAETPPLANANGLPPIGRAISNTGIYILDEQLHRARDGAIGEIYVGGAGLARGYHNRPEMTAERFIANPFSDNPGDRLYKTGDLGRCLPDGQIEFLGRTDGQVKIGGYRVEMNEIVAALVKHPGVLESAVISRDNSVGQKMLVAYVVPSREESPPNAVNLREFLRQTLPEYMIPAEYVLLKSMPFTCNGKVDQTALPMPGSTDGRPEGPRPRTELEEKLAKIVSELLKIETIALDDDYFLLGGHSLLGAQLIVQIRNAVGVDIALRCLFEAPTVAQLAALIQRTMNSRTDQRM